MKRKLNQGENSGNQHFSVCSLKVLFNVVVVFFSSLLCLLNRRRRSSDDGYGKFRNKILIFKFNIPGFILVKKRRLNIRIKHYYWSFPEILSIINNRKQNCIYNSRFQF